MYSSLFVAAAAALGAPAAPDTLAVTGGGGIYSVDSSSGAAVLLNTTSLAMHCLARANDGALWSLADVGGGVGQLVEIDGPSGATTLHSTIDLSGVARGASFDADG